MSSSVSHESNEKFLDSVSDDILALIVQYLLVKEILKFCRIDSRRRACNQSPSWAAVAWLRSTLAINCNGYMFTNWLIRDVGSVNDRVLLSTWQSSTPVLRHVLPDLLREYQIHSNDESYIPFMQSLIALLDEPASEIIIKNDVSYEVLTNLKQSQFHPWERYRFVQDTCHLRFILSATPYLQCLSITWDAYALCRQMPDPDDIFTSVPHLTTLSFTQEDSNQSNTGRSILPIRRTLQCLPKLQCVSFDNLCLSIQDMIDIVSQPRLQFIRLEGCEDYHFPIADEDADQGGLPVRFRYVSTVSHKFLVSCGLRQYCRDDDEYDEDDEENEELHCDAEFMVPGDERVEEEEEDDEEYRLHPKNMKADLEFINASLALPSTLSSLRARLPLARKMRSILFQPTEADRYVRHLRCQIERVYTSINQAFDTKNEKKRKRTAD